ncbi:hypothetical protein D9M71_506310 [compost metagenome]
MCSKLCNNAWGTASARAVRNTAVPCTRCGGCAAMLAMNNGNGSADSSSRSTIILRPRFQVVIRMNKPIPAITGNAPPWKIFGALAAKYRLSTNKKPSSNGTASQRGVFHANSTTAADSKVVINMVPVTATP